MSGIRPENGFALTISITITDKCRLTVKNTADPNVETVHSEKELSRDQLKNEFDYLRLLLERFQEGLVPSDQRSPRVAGEALRKLHLAGRGILYKLFEKEKLPRAQEMCRSACHKSGNSDKSDRLGWDPNSLAPPVIEVRTSLDYGLPIDLLPLLEPLKPEPVETMDDLGRVAASFLGFSAIVKRTFGNDPPARPLRIDNTDCFPLKMFWDGATRRLPNAKEAKRIFEESAANFDLKGGPWPNGTESEEEERFRAEVAGYLGEPETSFDKRTGRRPDQLCYFFCHCDTTPANFNDHILYLGNDSLLSSQRKVELGDLEDELWQLDLRNDKQRKAALALGKAVPEPALRPLVFLNACGSASLNPAAAMSFPKLFLSKDMGFFGFIGTEVTVPDAFGVLFAEVFLRYFVGGLPLGRALHAARWHMLRWYKSPLGILYTLYAEPEIETCRKIPSLLDKLPGKTIN